MTRLLIASLVPALAVAAGTVHAQVTVQQPVVSNFGVNTTVSVPDRGTAFLGGVSRSASSRSRYGFWPRVGSTYGWETSHSNITASVYIHDLRAMDEYLLGLDTGVAPPRSPAITARGMLSGEGSRLVRSERREPSEPSTVARASTSATGPTGLSAERSWTLGLRAESEGRFGVAKLHFEAAARNGSTAARDRLAELVAAE